VAVFDCLAGIADDGVGLRRLVRVQRQGTRHGKPYSPWSDDITRLATTAQQVDAGIRGHWGLENRLHWVKDVVFKEEACPLKLV
jgi:predicted transposase YbfD/YdcC